MKMITKYLDHALQFEHMAAAETHPDLKASLLKQAADYRKLAAKRAAQLGLSDPSSPQSK
jgi:hypothetical protein